MVYINQENVIRKMDTKLLEVLEKEAEKEKSLKKKKKFRLRKEKPLNYYYGWDKKE